MGLGETEDKMERWIYDSMNYLELYNISYTATGADSFQAISEYDYKYNIKSSKSKCLWLCDGFADKVLLVFPLKSYNDLEVEKMHDNDIYATARKSNCIIWNLVGKCTQALRHR